MQPLTIITGVLLGTSTAISFGLAVVLLIAWILGSDAPGLAAEMQDLAFYTVLFLGMTVLTACGFVGLLKKSPWRWLAQAAMWAGLAVVIVVMMPPAAG